MPARTSRAGAVQAALFAKAALVLAPAGVAAAIFALPAIEVPSIEKPEFPTGETTAEAGPRVDLGGIGRRMTFVAQFPEPEPIVPDGENNDPDGGVETPPPTTQPGVPEIRFLGAIAEPNRYVALLRIDGRQKFLAPGDTYQSVRVVDVTPGEVRLEIDGAPAEAAVQTIALADRTGPRWSEATPEATGGTQGGGDGASGEAPPAIPNMPSGFTPPPGMSPEQIQSMREFERRRQQAIEQGDGG